jgi:hypothetical protein
MPRLRQSPSEPIEDCLRSNTRDGVQALVNLLWQQPTRISPDGTLILAKLPAATTVLPREKPVHLSLNIIISFGTILSARLYSSFSFLLVSS